MASETKTRADLEEEIRQLEILCEDVNRAYVVLYRGCAAGMACRDIVLREGSMKNILAVYDRLQKAMNEADHELYGETPEERERAERVYCTTCKKFLTTEAEKQGHCIVCFA